MINVIEESYNIEISESNPIVIDAREVVSISQTTTNKIERTYEAGETIGSQKVVYYNEGKIYLASSGNLTCVNKIIGVTSQAGVTGNFINVVMFGELNGFVGLIEGTMYYLNVDGNITETIATTGISVEIGKAMSSDILFVNIDNYLIR